MSNDVHASESLIAAVLVQLAIIILAARLAGAAAVKVRQPRAAGEIIAGLLLRPSYFGFLPPQASLSAASPASASQGTSYSQIVLAWLMLRTGVKRNSGRPLRPWPRSRYKELRRPAQRRTLRLPPRVISAVETQSI